ncbi:hypothetical protein, partial [Methylococcus capsulatus]|uniref:hypothetical protein n=1 Tax=Methylococcus capsulatus TaxID=414 RepID=UPI002FD9013D
TTGTSLKILTSYINFSALNSPGPGNDKCEDSQKKVEALVEQLLNEHTLLAHIPYRRFFISF